MAALPGSEKSPDRESEIPIVRGFPAFGAAVLEFELLLPQAASVELSATVTPSRMWTLNRLTSSSFCPRRGHALPREVCGPPVPAIVCTIPLARRGCQALSPRLQRNRDGCNR